MLTQMMYGRHIQDESSSLTDIHCSRDLMVEKLIFLVSTDKLANSP